MILIHNNKIMEMFRYRFVRRWNISWIFFVYSRFLEKKNVDWKLRESWIMPFHCMSWKKNKLVYYNCFLMQLFFIIISYFKNKFVNLITTTFVQNSIMHLNDKISLWSFNKNERFRHFITLMSWKNASLVWHWDG